MKSVIRTALALTVAASVGHAARTEAQNVTRLTSQPERVEIVAGESVPLAIRAYGPDGAQVSAPLRIAGARGGIRAARRYRQRPGQRGAFDSLPLFGIRFIAVEQHALRFVRQVHVESAET